MVSEQAQESSLREIDVERLRSDVLTRVLHLYALFGALLTAWAVFLEVQGRDWALAIYHASLYCALIGVMLYRRLPLRTRTTLLVLILLGVSLSEFIYYGPFGEGVVFLVSALALVTLMIGKRAGYLSVAASVVVLLLVASLHVSGTLEVHWLQDLKADKFKQWTSTLVEIAVFGSTLNYMIATLLERLVVGLEAKRESEARYKLLAEHVGDVIWTVDPDFCCTYASPSIELLFGVPASSVVGRDLRKLAFTDLKDDFGHYAAPLHAGPSTQFRSERIDATVRHRDGRLIPTETVLSALHGESGTVRGMLGVTRDITARVEMERERESLQNQLRHSQRMESVGHLAGGVAHDLNNLLQGILAYAELSRDKLPPGAPAGDDIDEIMKGCERARELVRQLLAFGRRQVLQLTDVNLNDLISDLIKMIRRVIGDHITLDFVAGSDLQNVRADRGQIEQVLMNLCVNARDAMPEGGTLRIETCNSTLDEGIRESGEAVSPVHCVLILVSDTGCGMDEATQRRLFEPFFTTKEVGKGTGLGLSTAFGIIRQHDGMITVESTPGTGTQFRIYLPEAPASGGHRPRPAAAPSSGGRETILFADDNETVRTVTEMMLRGAGYTVISACDGIEAVQLFDSQSDSIDIALLDVVMPGLGGDGVAKHIASRRPEIPILFCSGFSEDTVHTGFVLVDGTDLIQKPYRREELLRRLRESLNRSQP